MDLYAHCTPGERLYREWCVTPDSDRANYWRLMNPDDKTAWERLALLVNGQLEGAVDRMRESRTARARGLAQTIAECRDDARLAGIRELAAEIVALLGGQSGG